MSLLAGWPVKLVCDAGLYGKLFGIKPSILYRVGRSYGGGL